MFNHFLNVNKTLIMIKGLNSFQFTCTVQSVVVNKVWRNWQVSALAEVKVHLTVNSPWTIHTLCLEQVVPGVNLIVLGLNLPTGLTLENHHEI